MYDFGIRFKTGQIDSVDEYFKFLESRSNDKLFFDAGLKRDKFNDL